MSQNTTPEYHPAADVQINLPKDLNHANPIQSLIRQFLTERFSSKIPLSTLQATADRLVETTIGVIMEVDEDLQAAVENGAADGDPWSDEDIYHFLRLELGRRIESAQDEIRLQQMTDTLATLMVRNAELENVIRNQHQVLLAHDKAIAELRQEVLRLKIKP